MLKTSVALFVLLAPLAFAGAAQAAMGPHAGDCAEGSGKNGMLVKIVGLKSHEGFVRVQSYGGDPAGWFEKGAYLERVDVPPAAHTIEVCLPVPKPGLYAVSVRHSRGGAFSMNDGAGFSGNPNMSLMDAMFKRKPPAGEVQVKVSGVAHVSVTMNYVEGGQLRPIASSGVTETK
ncbi:uncharacterized protein (DUF2141 family) [Sphingomonas vulcanisoli]|uniref:Uncharacterized protein (DUF2141 family) n=1 Tax=Sphingomonas vulcanisoli TaxID=1658060 RepID=A0ABX0TN24_9SPHN|nr:DUF2141 domain-containing protein [Sphingomonas vulcanisoli]NIJ06922.1 uncharacterized protein (DUF2141 family) [Sphingomonas vulcanisoli]